MTRAYLNNTKLDEEMAKDKPFSVPLARAVIENAAAAIQDANSALVKQSAFPITQHSVSGTIPSNIFYVQIELGERAFIPTIKQVDTSVNGTIGTYGGVGYTEGYAGRITVNGSGQQYLLKFKRAG